MNYYYKYWKDRNEKLHDEDFQRKRIIEWQKNEQIKALEGEHPQVRKHSTEKQLEVETCTTDHIRQWTHVLKQIKKGEKYDANDIRSYFRTR